MAGKRAQVLPRNCAASSPSRVRRIGGSAAAPLLALRAYVAGHDALVDVPAHVERDAARLRATGDIELRQTALGLTPFGLMFGALRVADTIGVHFDIVARPVVMSPK